VAQRERGPGYGNMSKNNYFQKNYGGLASDPENNNKGT
jgi:hypothetical protein